MSPNTQGIQKEVANNICKNKEEFLLQNLNSGLEGKADQRDNTSLNINT